MNQEFPLVYCNGDSYSNERYHISLKGKTYANIVGEYCNGFVINAAVSGSCNRRIIRTSLHDLIHQRQINPSQKIIALINLSFELRSELWIDDLVPDNPVESNFVPHMFSAQRNWRGNLLTGQSINTQQIYKVDSKFYEKFSQGRAYFYSPYAERINLLTDLIMLKSTLDALNIDFLIFQGPAAELLDSDYLLNFFKQHLAGDTRIFDLETFGFCDWALQQGFVPLDFLDRPEIGHYGPDAHRAFANLILIPKLTELHVI